MFPAFTDSRECKLLKVSKANVKITLPCLEMHTALYFVLFHLAMSLVFYRNILEDIRLTLHGIYIKLVGVATAEI